MEQDNKNHSWVLICAFSTVVLWASAFVFTKVGLREFTPQGLGAVRYLIASAFLLLVALIKKSRLPRLRDLPLFLASGLTGFGLYIVVFNLASSTVSAATGSILISTTPIITSVLAALIFKERISGLCWLAIAVEFGGILLITLHDGVFSFNAGVAWMLVAALSVSVYNLLQRKLVRTYGPFEANAFSMIAGTVFLLPFLPGGIQTLCHTSAWQIANAAYLGIFPSAIGYLLWVIALSKARKVSAVTNFMFFTPLLSTLLSFAVIGEVPSWAALAGGVIIIGGSVLFQRFAGRG